MLTYLASLVLSEHPIHDTVCAGVFFHRLLHGTFHPKENSFKQQQNNRSWFMKIHCMKKKQHIIIDFTWTPSTLSTNKWPLFLLIKSAVIESEYEFNVAGTSSYGELLCSILRHRLFYLEKFIKETINIFYSSLCNSHLPMWKCLYWPTKTALVACFKIISINSDDTCEQCSRTQNCCYRFHFVRMRRLITLKSNQMDRKKIMLDWRRNNYALIWSATLQFHLSIFKIRTRKYFNAHKLSET